jgi:predicted metal-binding membrane protein
MGLRNILIVVLLSLVVLAWSYQPYMDMINGMREEYLQSAVYTALSEAKIKGDFTSSDLENIQNTVAQTLGYPASEVSVSGTTVLTLYGSPMSLTITIPSQISLFSDGSSNAVMLTATETVDSEALVG